MPDWLHFQTLYTCLVALDTILLVIKPELAIFHLHQSDHIFWRVLHVIAVLIWLTWVLPVIWRAGL